MSKGRSPWKIKRKKERRPIKEVPPEYKSGSRYACMPCADERGVAVIMDVGSKNLKDWYNNNLFLKCPECGSQKVCYNSTGNVQWYPLHLSSSNSYIFSLDIIREAQDWDADVLTQQAGLSIEEISEFRKWLELKHGSE